MSIDSGRAFFETDDALVANDATYSRCTLEGGGGYVAWAAVFGAS